MRRLLLKVVAEREDGRFGVLIDRDANLPFAVSIELPYRDNQQNISSIPGGVYLCRRYSSDKYPQTFEVLGVPGRSLILFHVANRDDDLRGCIGVAENYMVWNDGSAAVGNSQAGFTEFLHRYWDEEVFELEIVGS